MDLTTLSLWLTSNPMLACAVAAGLGLGMVACFAMSGGRPATPTADDQFKDPTDDNTREESDIVAVAGEMSPWLISLAVHAAIVLLAMFIVWSAFTESAPKKEPIIPTIIPSKKPGAPLTMQAIVRPEDTSTDRRVVAPPQPQPVKISKQLEVNDQLIGITQGAAGKANPFGAGLGDGPSKATLFGVRGGDVKHVVYLVDASGSLVDTFPFVIAELKRSIGELTMDQTFAVVFFQGDRVLTPWPGMRKATHFNKRQAMMWIDPTSDNVRPAGADTNPIPAIKQALHYRPQLVFLLSDNITGRQKYEIDQQVLLTETRKANLADTRINTIQFLHPDPLEAYGLKGTLEQIARQSGGRFKFQDARELGIEQ